MRCARKRSTHPTLDESGELLNVAEEAIEFVELVELALEGAQMAGGARLDAGAVVGVVVEILDSVGVLVLGILDSMGVLVLEILDSMRVLVLEILDSMGGLVDMQVFNS